MSTGSKITLGASVVFTASVVYYVHVKQKKDRESLREGVIQDIQRQEMKKRQNIKMLQDQMELTKVLQAQRDTEMAMKMEISSTDKPEKRTVADQKEH